MLNQRTMEKFGVDVNEPAKEASTNKRGVCPECDLPLLAPDESNVPRCPVHGTKPFEAC